MYIVIYTCYLYCQFYIHMLYFRYTSILYCPNSKKSNSMGCTSKQELELGTPFDSNNKLSPHPNDKFRIRSQFISIMDFYIKIKLWSSSSIANANSIKAMSTMMKLSFTVYNAFILITFRISSNFLKALFQY
jgi:hypothetical protein